MAHSQHRGKCDTIPTSGATSWISKPNALLGKAAELKLDQLPNPLSWGTKTGGAIMLGVCHRSKTNGILEESCQRNIRGIEEMDFSQGKRAALTRGEQGI